MKYTIKVYRGGVHTSTKTIAAKSARLAVKELVDSGYPFTHVKVTGKTVKRYDHNLRPITGAPRFFKTASRELPSILVMIGNSAEIQRFATKKERDEVFEKCTESASVEFARKDPAQTDTTVCLDVMYASKDGSTLKKTSNGYVVSATWKDLPTRTSIVAPSGKNSVKGSGLDAWSYGSNPYLSRPNPTSSTKQWYKKVNIEGYDDVGLTPLMKEMNGKAISVRPSFPSTFEGAGYYWKEEWLSDSNIPLYVTKDLHVGDVAQLRSGGAEFLKNDYKKGQMVVVDYCPCGCQLYHTATEYFHKSWLTDKGKKNDR